MGEIDPIARERLRLGWDMNDVEGFSRGEIAVREHGEGHAVLGLRLRALGCLSKNKHRREQPSGHQLVTDIPARYDVAGHEAWHDQQKPSSGPPETSRVPSGKCRS